MDLHLVVEILLGLVAFFGGMFVKGLNDSVKSLHQQDAILIEKLHVMEKLVAGEYIKRSEVKETLDAVFASLRRIEEKLDGKADK